MRDSAGHTHRITLAAVAAVATGLLLAGCVDSPGDAPAPTASATPTPTPTASAPTSTPTPTAAPVSIDCVSLVPADAFAMLFKDFTLVPSYVPGAGSLGAEVLDAGGTVCGWSAADGTVVAVGVASLDPEVLTAKANDLVVSSHSVPTYGVEGYFQVLDGVGEAEAFTGSYWIVATSTAFLEPGEVAPILENVLGALP